MCQFSFRRLFGLFTVETIVKLFTCVLLEQQIVLVSGDYELPILVSECLTALLYVPQPHPRRPALPWGGGGGQSPHRAKQCSLPLYSRSSLASLLSSLS